MAEFNLEQLRLEDLVFILGGAILQGNTSDNIELEVLLRLEELVSIKIDERTSGIPLDTTIH